MASVNAKIDAWAQSGRGKKKLNNKLKEYIKNDTRTTEAGSQVVTKRMMEEMAAELVYAVKAKASAAGLPSSVQSDVDSLRQSKVVMRSDLGFTCELNFTADLHRPSLDPSEYPRGADNIIATFNKGYDGADPHVWGWWHGEIWHAKAERAGLQFIQSAVDDFTAKYGRVCDVSIEVSGEY